METSVVKQIISRIVSMNTSLGEAYPEVKEETGAEHYNVRLTFTFPQKEGQEETEVEH